MVYQQEPFGGHKELSVFRTEPPPPYPGSSVHMYPTPGSQFSQPTHSAGAVTNPVTVAASGASHRTISRECRMRIVSQSLHKANIQLLCTGPETLALMLML